MRRKNPVTTITIRTDSLLNMTDAVEYLCITRRTMFRWINKGKVRSIRIGGHLFFSTDELHLLEKELKRSCKPNSKQVNSKQVNSSKVTS